MILATAIQKRFLSIIKSWSKSEYSAYTIDVDVMGTCVAGPFVKLEEAKDLFQIIQNARTILSVIKQMVAQKKYSF